MADGFDAVYTALTGYAGLTALVPAARIISDDALPLNVTAPAIQLELVSGFDDRTVAYGATVHVTQRIRIRIHAVTAASRSAIRKQVRSALFANERPTVSGLTNVVIHTDSEGPDGLAPESEIRIGIQDATVTFNETR